MVVGLTRPDNGSILLGEDDVTNLPMYIRARRGIAYLPQEASVFRKLTVSENILAILETIPITREEREEKLSVLMGELGISHLADSRAYSLSGGEGGGLRLRGPWSYRLLLYFWTNRSRG